jgi:thiol-disulfide isomerase/thioredoxin
VTRISFLCAAFAAMSMASMGCTPATEAETPTGGGCTIANGKEACEIEAEHVGGEGPTDLANARGMVVVVDFWATWCDPCKKSFPVYQDLLDKYAGKVAVIAVSVDDPDDKTADDLKAFAKENGNVTFPIVWDKTKTTSNQYEPPTMPTSYIIDKEGIVRHIHVGFKGDAQQEMDEQIEALIK